MSAMRKLVPRINEKGDLEIVVTQAAYKMDGYGVVQSAKAAFKECALPAGRRLAQHFPHMELTWHEDAGSVSIVAFVEYGPPNAGDRHQH